MTQGHALKLPDRRNAADAAGAADAADTMQHLAVDHAAPLSKRATRRDNMSHNASDTPIRNSASTVDHCEPGAVSKQTIQAQHRQSSTHLETPLAHRAVLNRLNGVHSKKSSTDNTSSPSTQPVLVKSYSSPEQTRKAEMGRRRKGNAETSELPPLESFSFHDILKEIDPDVKVSIDAIAEIYGRSKLSLADEYGSHRPPHGELDLSVSSDQAVALEEIQTSRLERVEEYTPNHSRRHSLALVGASNQPKSGLPSNAVAATPAAMLVEQRRQSTSSPISIQADSRVALLPYILSWLRNSGVRNNNSSDQPSADPRAAESLHRILGDIQ